MGKVSVAEQYGVTVGELAGEAGQVMFASAPYAAYDGSGSYSGGSYYWGWMTSPVYATAIPFDTLVHPHGRQRPRPGPGSSWRYESAPAVLGRPGLVWASGRPTRGAWHATA
jgi:hypothetical protein